MSLGAIIKRHKRTLINFQESFLIPFVTKAAHRYMQFDPENYPVADYRFDAVSTLGLMAREYEVTQLVQLLQTMQADSPIYGQLVEAIIDNMNLSNREELLLRNQQASQSSPEEQQAAALSQQSQIAFQEAQTIATRTHRRKGRSQRAVAELPDLNRTMPSCTKVDERNFVVCVPSVRSLRPSRGFLHWDSTLDGRNFAS